MGGGRIGAGQLLRELFGPRSADRFGIGAPGRDGGRVHCRAVIDIRLLREKPDEVRAAYERLGATVDLDGVIAADARVRDLKNESQTLQAEQNRLSKEIGRAAAGEARERAKADSTALKEKIEKLDGELAAAEAALDDAAARAAEPAAPVGAGRQGRERERRAARGGHEAQLRLRAQAALGSRHRAGHHRLRARREDLGLALLRAQGLGRAAAARADHVDARPAHAEARLRRDLPALHGPPRVPGRHRQPAQVRREPLSRRRSRTSGSSRPPRSRSPTSIATRSSTARACRSSTSPSPPASGASRWRPAATRAASSADTSSTKSSS